ncbi:putative reverse transcriptase domain-containing protein [Tanacetum coccineum]
MPNTRSGASRTREGINEQIDHRLAGVLGARDAARNLEPLIRGNGNGGANVNGNGNGGGNGYNPGGFVHVARECTYQDFLKCQPLSFNGTERVVGLTHWFEKMETVFHISNCPEKYQVKYATCTLLNKVYCLRNEIQKMETELWNLAVKGNDMTTYARRFQELVSLCTRMVPNEEDKVERFIGGLPDNIQGKGCARSVENKRRLENNLRDTRGQQSVFKRQNVRGKNVERSYMAGNNEKKGRVGHMTRDCKVTVTPNTQRAPVGNQPGNVCYECGRPGHFRKDYPKLRNQNRRKKTGNKNGNKTKNQTGCNEAIARAYAIGGGGVNPDFNVVTGMFLLNNCYASMLFDSGADKSFVSSTFSNSN